MTAKIIHLPTVSRLVHDMPQEVTQAEWDAYHAARKAQWAANRKRTHRQFNAGDAIPLLAMVAAALIIALPSAYALQTWWLQ